MPRIPLHRDESQTAFPFCQFWPLNAAGRVPVLACISHAFFLAMWAACCIHWLFSRLNSSLTGQAATVRKRPYRVLRTRGRLKTECLKYRSFPISVHVLVFRTLVRIIRFGPRSRAECSNAFALALQFCGVQSKSVYSYLHTEIT